MPTLWPQASRYYGKRQKNSENINFSNEDDVNLSHVVIFINISWVLTRAAFMQLKTCLWFSILAFFDSAITKGQSSAVNRISEYLTISQKKLKIAIVIHFVWNCEFLPCPFSVSINFLCSYRTHVVRENRLSVRMQCAHDTRWNRIALQCNFPYRKGNKIDKAIDNRNIHQYCVLTLHINKYEMEECLRAISARRTIHWYTLTHEHIIYRIVIKWTQWFYNFVYIHFHLMYTNEVPAVRYYWPFAALLFLVVT